MARNITSWVPRAEPVIPPVISISERVFKIGPASDPANRLWCCPDCCRSLGVLIARLVRSFSGPTATRSMGRDLSRLHQQVFRQSPETLGFEWHRPDCVRPETSLMQLCRLLPSPRMNRPRSMVTPLRQKLLPGLACVRSGLAFSIAARAPLVSRG